MPKMQYPDLNNICKKYSRFPSTSLQLFVTFL